MLRGLQADFLNPEGRQHEHQRDPRQAEARGEDREHRSGRRVECVGRALYRREVFGLRLGGHSGGVDCRGGFENRNIRRFGTGPR